jgi:hypothetical protein
MEAITMDTYEMKRQCHHYQLTCVESPCAECPGMTCKCGALLEHFDDYGHDYYYCPECNDTAYNEFGKEIGKII